MRGSSLRVRGFTLLGFGAGPGQGTWRQTDYGWGFTLFCGARAADKATTRLCRENGRAGGEAGGPSTRGYDYVVVKGQLGLRGLHGRGRNCAETRRETHQRGHGTSRALWRAFATFMHDADAETRPRPETHHAVSARLRLPCPTETTRRHPSPQRQWSTTREDTCPRLPRQSQA